MLPRAEESRLESSRSDAEQKSSVGILDADETGNKLSDCYGDRGCFLCRLSYASREFSVDPASAHVTRHGSGFERSRHAQSVDRAELRRADEAHRSAANRCRPSRSCPSFSFRIPVVSCRPLFGPDRADRGELACAADVRLVFISLHAAQTANATFPHGCSSRFFSSGNSRISWRLRGCIARTTRGQDTGYFRRGQKNPNSWNGRAYSRHLR